MRRESCILYQNPDAIVFLVDIPTSIASAQGSAEHHAPPKHLLSSVPLRTPYPPCSEPKTDAARAKVLGRIPASERAFHAAIAPLVDKALNEIRTHHRTDWCLPRRVLDDSRQGCGNSRTPGGVYVGKRRGREANEKLQVSQTGELGSSPYLSNNTDVIELTSGPSELPPVILSPGVNRFSSLSELQNHAVRNTSPEDAIIRVRSICEYSNGSIVDGDCLCQGEEQYQAYIVPRESNFLLCKLPISQLVTQIPEGCSIIPGLPLDKKFNLILLDPPWANRSVRRSGHYRAQSYRDSELLTTRIQEILQLHSTATPPPLLDSSGSAERGCVPSIAAIWVTNSAKARKTAYDAMQGSGFSICEEWIWIKTTTDGQPITPLGGLWRKPYEVLVIGERRCLTTTHHNGNSNGIFRRVIATVPDIHSRKPSLKELFEKIFFPGALDGQPGEVYSALEVFARNLTAGWWACGDEVLKFNLDDLWVS